MNTGCIMILLEEIIFLNPSLCVCMLLSYIDSVVNIPGEYHVIIEYYD